LPTEEVPDFGRPKQIGQEISEAAEEIILVGHSLGASMLLKYLSENEVRKSIAGIFLISTPFWKGDEDWVDALKLQPGFEEKLNKKTPLFFYHCRDDEEVPFDQLAVYKQKIPWATFREIAVGGHQVNNDLTLVATDIISLHG
jgi:predicted alpha/beta hydrolase family esterase